MVRWILATSFARVQPIILSFTNVIVLSIYSLRVWNQIKKNDKFDYIELTDYLSKFIFNSFTYTCLLENFIYNYTPFKFSYYVDTNTVLWLIY